MYFQPSVRTVCFEGESLFSSFDFTYQVIFLQRPTFLLHYLEDIPEIFRNSY